MDRRHFLAGLGATLLASAGPVAARTNGEIVIDRIRAQLRSQGYTRISVERTLLGRVRILATGPGSRGALPEERAVVKSNGSPKGRIVRFSRRV